MDNKFVVGFFMAWGNFLNLPCPLKVWDNAHKRIMLMFLPSVGAVIGVLWVVIACVLYRFSIPTTVCAFLMTAYIFVICGFMHLDGFMDVNDAILSRRPLAERQRILKDSTVGAFAAVSLGLLLIGWFACMFSCLSKPYLPVFFFVPIVSRFLAGYEVITERPMEQSQYYEGEKREGSPLKDNWKIILGMVIQCSILVTIAIVIWVFLVAHIEEFSQLDLAMIPIAAEIVAGLVASVYARRQLGGMSGDIAGYIICWSEFAAIFAISVIN